jgi:hypothetical protein
VVVKGLFSCAAGLAVQPASSNAVIVTATATTHRLALLNMLDPFRSSLEPV